MARPTLVAVPVKAGATGVAVGASKVSSFSSASRASSSDSGVGMVFRRWRNEAAVGLNALLGRRIGVGDARPARVPVQLLCTGDGAWYVEAWLLFDITLTGNLFGDSGGLARASSGFTRCGRLA